MKKVRLSLSVLASILCSTYAFSQPASTIWEAETMDSTDMGPVFNDFTSYEPWIQHESLGWLYIGNENADNLWVWSRELGWLYTNEEINPYFWSYDHGWIYTYFEPSDGSRIYSSEGWTYFFNDSQWFQVKFTNAFAGVDNCFAWKSWSFKAGNSIYAKPTFYKGILYAGSNDGKLYAINSHNGQENWSYSSGNQIRSDVLVYDEKLFFESGNKLYALTLEGELVWSFTLYSGTLINANDAWDFYHSSPIEHEGNIYIGTQNGYLYGVNAETGEQVFQRKTPYGESLRIPPLIHNGNIYIGDWNGRFYAINLETTDMVWTYNTNQDGWYSWDNSIQTPPVLYGNSIIFAGRSTRVYSLDADTGEKNWIYQTPTTGWLVGGPQLENGILYLGSSNQHLLHAINADTGELIWQTHVDGRIWGTPIIYEGDVYAATAGTGSTLYMVDKDTGEIKEEKQIMEGSTYAQFHSSPIINSDKVIIGTDKGFLHAIRISK